MSQRIKAVLWMETLKMSRSRVFPVSIYFFLFIGIMMGLLMFMGMHPEIASRSSTISMKTSFLAGSDWAAYYDLLLQVVLTVVVIGSGIITSWDFGREFTDKTVKDLLVLPLPRGMIVAAKLVVLSGWSLMLSVIVLLAAMIMGLLMQLPGWNAVEFGHFLLTYLVCSVLNILLITPVAFVASAGRGYMLPISFVILVMILTQIVFLGIPSFTYWFPWALPALVSGVAGQAMPKAGFLSYLMYGLFVVGAFLGTNRWWKHADIHV